MPMNELLKTRLFGLLSELSQVTNEEMQIAYGDFMEHIGTVSQSEQDYYKQYRTLNYTRIEFISLQAFHQYGQGGKCA